MHICFIEDTDLHGGTQIWVIEATNNFLAAGHDVTILTSRAGWVAKECAKTAARVVTYDYEDVVSKDHNNIGIWTDALKDCDVAICTVHPPRQDFHCSVFAAECIKQAELKTILIPKSGTIVPEYKREFYLPDESISSRVITITDFTRRYLVDDYKIPADLVELIYQGTELDLFTPDENRMVKARKQYPLPKDAWPILGNVGSFETRKGQVVLLEAMKKITTGPLPNAHLMLVGDGPDEKMLKQKTKELGLEENVTFFPFTREPVYIFEILDALVLSSLYKEGLPNVLLEAMAMKVPVVASRMAGVPEIVEQGKTGYMVEPGDIDELADAIVTLANNKADYEKMRQNCRDLMVQNFDKQKQFDCFLDYFKKILAT